MRLFHVGRLAPDGLFLREHIQGVGVNGASARDHVLALHRLGIVHPSVLPVLFFNVQMQSGLDDGLCSDGTALSFASLGLGQPLLARELGAVLLERCDTVRNDGVDLSRVAFLLLQSTGGDPNLVRSRDRLASLIEDLACAVRRLKTCQRQPQLLRVRNDLDRTSQQDSSVFGVVLELDAFFPKLDRRRNVLEGCTGTRVSDSPERSTDITSPFLKTRFLEFVSVSSSTARNQIRTDCGNSCTAFARMILALSGVCEGNRISKAESLANGGRPIPHIQLARCDPDVLVFRTMLATLGDELACLDGLAGHVLEPGGGHPSGCVLRVSLDERLQQCTSALDVTGTARDC